MTAAVTLTPPPPHHHHHLHHRLVLVVAQVVAAVVVVAVTAAVATAATATAVVLVHHPLLPLRTTLLLRDRPARRGDSLLTKTASEVTWCDVKYIRRIEQHQSPKYRFISAVILCNYLQDYHGCCVSVFAIGLIS